MSRPIPRDRHPRAGSSCRPRFIGELELAITPFAKNKFRRESPGHPARLGMEPENSYLTCSISTSAGGANRSFLKGVSSHKK